MEKVKKNNIYLSSYNTKHYKTVSCKQHCLYTSSNFHRSTLHRLYATSKQAFFIAQDELIAMKKNTFVIEIPTTKEDNLVTAPVS